MLINRKIQTLISQANKLFSNDSLFNVQIKQGQEMIEQEDLDRILKIPLSELEENDLFNLLVGGDESWFTQNGFKAVLARIMQCMVPKKTNEAIDADFQSWFLVSDWLIKFNWRQWTKNEIEVLDEFFKELRIEYFELAGDLEQTGLFVEYIEFLVSLYDDFDEQLKFWSNQSSPKKDIHLAYVYWCERDYLTQNLNKDSSPVFVDDFAKDLEKLKQKHQYIKLLQWVSSVDNLEKVKAILTHDDVAPMAEDIHKIIKNLAPPEDIVQSVLSYPSNKK